MTTPWGSHGWRSRPPPRRIAFIVGAVVAGVGAGMVPAALVSVGYREWGSALGITSAAAITAGLGVLVAWRAGRPGELAPKEAFAAVAFAWVAAILFGTLPYLLTGSITNITDAVFESTAGMTTTGATILPDPRVLPQGVLIWRSMTQWLGGMGIIALSIAVLPLIGAGGLRLARAEWAGPEPDRLTPRFRDTAKWLWYTYLGLTAAAVVLLALGDMDLFQAFAHAFTLVSTGGFSTEPTSLAGFGPYTQWIVIGFMFVAAISFTLHIRAAGRPAAYLHSAEFRYYVVILGAAIATIGIGVLLGEAVVGDAVRDTVFTATTLVTGTGYIITDFAAWTGALPLLIVGLMFMGGMAGSTTGALKTFRVGILLKSASSELRRLNRPHAVQITWLGAEPVPDSIVRNVQAFFLFYIASFFAGAVLLDGVQTIMGTDISFISATSAAASSLSNVGPALGVFGPTHNYVDTVWPGKCLLAFLMILGRLEIFPVLLLFTRGFWRR